MGVVAKLPRYESGRSYGTAIGPGTVIVGIITGVVITGAACDELALKEADESGIV